MRDKMKRRIQELRNEMKKEFLEQAAKKAAKEFKDEWDAAENPQTATVTLVKPVKKKRRPKVLTGFTTAETLESRVGGLLRLGPLTKKAVYAGVILIGNLRAKDLETHPDGKTRLYKTMDRTRRNMIENGRIKTKNGVWTLV